MAWLSKFLQKDKCSALYSVGDDAPSVFFEIWYTSANSQIRNSAKGIAKKLLSKYEKKLVGGEWGGGGVDQFFECMFVLRCKHEMEMDTADLIAKADQLWKVVSHMQRLPPWPTHHHHCNNRTRFHASPASHPTPFLRSCHDRGTACAIQIFYSACMGWRVWRMCR
jgi:hypothetical protein